MNCQRFELGNLHQFQEDWFGCTNNVLMDLLFTRRTTILFMGYWFVCVVFCQMNLLN